MKYLLKLRRRKAFTLVELIIVMAIMAGLLACVAAFSGPVQDMVKMTASKADALAANKIIGDYIENRLSFAEKLDMYYAVDLTTATADIGNTYTAYKDLINLEITADPNTLDKAGMLIFHYEANASEPEKSGYRLYDIPLDNTSPTNISTALWSGTAMRGGVFADCFYKHSQNLMVLSTEVKENEVREDVYISADIYPYDCTEDYLVRNASGALAAGSLYIEPDTLENYYKFLAGDASGVDISTLAPQRAGAKESVSFSIINAADASKCRVNADFTDLVGNKSGGGSDTIIFYYIPHF